MTGTLNHLGLASADGSGATSSHGHGAAVRTRLAGAAAGIAVAAMTALGAAPAWAEHNPGHDVVARAQADTLQIRVDELEAGLAEEATTRATDDGDLQTQIDDLEDKALLQHGVKTVFLTSAKYDADLKTAGGGLNGLQGADNICNAHALEGVVPPGHYVAWLSTEDKDARDRLPAIDEGYVLADGVTFVATSKDDLLDGSILNAITLDEFGVDIVFSSVTVWTATAADGTFRLQDGAAPCDSWATNVFSASPLINDGFGRAGPALLGLDWTVSQQFGISTALCSVALFLYCFER